MRNFQETRPGAVIQFLKTLADMQDLTLKRLTTTVEEERSRQELLEHYNSRASEASKRRQQLDLDLQHIRRECEKAQSQRTGILTKLKADLLDVKDSKQERMTALRTRYENRMREHQEVFDAKRQDLENRIKALKESNAKLKSQSQDEEMTKKKATKRNVLDIEKIIGDFDTRVKEMAFALSENSEASTKYKRQLDELKEHFEKVDAESGCIKAEEKIAEARKAKLQAERDRKDQSAALVQAFWRGIIQREQYTVMKRSKKKKKGGGKKK
uniref:Dynein regulatory complex protein 10 n=1 Tax=Alexandrium andersonii TaxID=327968 RepID=A0A7S2CR21_9DINO